MQHPDGYASSGKKKKSRKKLGDYTKLKRKAKETTKQKVATEWEKIFAKYI